VTTAPAASFVTMVTPLGTFDSVGAVVSFTVTTKLPVVVRPFESVTEQLTRVEPRAKKEPFG
jgi:hypothetical protein